MAAASSSHEYRSPYDAIRQTATHSGPSAANVRVSRRVASVGRVELSARAVSPHTIHAAAESDKHNVAGVAANATAATAPQLPVAPNTKPRRPTAAD